MNNKTLLIILGNSICKAHELLHALNKLAISSMHESFGVVMIHTGKSDNIPKHYLNNMICYDEQQLLKESDNDSNFKHMLDEFERTYTFIKEPESDYYYIPDPIPKVLHPNNNKYPNTNAMRSISQFNINSYHRRQPTSRSGFVGRKLLKKRKGK